MRTMRHSVPVCSNQQGVALVLALVFLLLLTILDKFSGGPVGIDTLAAAIGEDKDTIEDVYEPFLIQEGFLDRTPRGRQATTLCYEYFGRKKTSPAQGPLL